MDNIPNLRLEVLIDYVLTKRNVCIALCNWRYFTDYKPQTCLELNIVKLIIHYFRLIYHLDFSCLSWVNFVATICIIVIQSKMLALPWYIAWGPVSRCSKQWDYFLPRPFPLGKDVVNIMQLRWWGQGDVYKSELWLVDTVHEGYLPWALIGQNKLTVQTYRDWTTV